MEAPGEKLIIRLWETIADKGIGSLLRPWQIRREERARLDVRREEIIVLARAETEAMQIRAGQRALAAGHEKPEALPVSDGFARESGKEEGPRRLLQSATEATVADAVRREVNVAKAIIHAESDLASDEQEPSADKPDTDWLYRWRDAASEVSSDQLQHLWGRVLAGEVKSPGSFSLRTLEFLRNISQKEARRIEILSQFVLEDFIYRARQDLLEQQGITFKFLLEMQDLGVISGVGGLGLKVKMVSMKPETFIRVIESWGRAVIAAHSDPGRVIELEAYPLTLLGKQVMALGTGRANEEYLRALGASLKAMGYEVTLGQYRTVGENQIQTFNHQPL
jgi:hypothetical protein